jgi:hypothetical protein
MESQRLLQVILKLCLSLWDYRGNTIKSNFFTLCENITNHQHVIINYVLNFIFC